MCKVKFLIKDDKVCSEHIHLMVIAFIELARAEYTLHTLHCTQDIHENIIPLQLLLKVISFYLFFLPKGIFNSVYKTLFKHSP